jgi:heme-degrading monooxygenase HmoA
MFARVARYEVEPGRTNEAVEAFRDAAAQLESVSGLTGGYVLADSEDGMIMTITFWESRAAMDSSEVKAAGLRRQAANSVDGNVVSVHCLDVPIEIGSNARSAV